jgi:DNA processing protein
LITATHAAEQGRPVLAVPGPVDEEQHTGCHQLLRDGATLCRGVDDILEEIGGLQPRPNVAPSRERSGPAPVTPPTAPAPLSPAPRPAVKLNDEEQRVCTALEKAARSMDELVRETSLPVPRLSTVLMGLQMRKLVRQLPGNRYEWSG